jgi:hypothetical protein
MPVNDGPDDCNVCRDPAWTGNNSLRNFPTPQPALVPPQFRNTKDEVVALGSSGNSVPHKALPRSALRKNTRAAGLEVLNGRQALQRALCRVLIERMLNHQTGLRHRSLKVQRFCDAVMQLTFIWSASTNAIAIS